MNENLNLVEILKDCPSGTKLYSTTLGDVVFESIAVDKLHPIIIKNNNYSYGFSADGKINFDKGECTLFPSKDQRDWSKFKLKKPKFDPKTLKPFDKVLVRDGKVEGWMCDVYSHKLKDDNSYMCISNKYYCCIPYNEETKHLVGTSDDCPEYYKWWKK